MNPQFKALFVILALAFSMQNLFAQTGKLQKVDTLQQVNISALAPLIRYGNNGNLVVNVAGTILASSSSVTEILSRTPGITINEGIINLQGKGEVIIYLNGTLVSSERLASIPTSQITKIELIANPSARYDAAGRAVISITTKSPDADGFSGRISQYLSSSPFAGESTNTFADIGFGKEQLLLSANVALQKGSGRELLLTTRLRQDANDYLNSELSTDWNRDFKLYATYGFGAKYNFSTASSISVTLSGNRDQLGGTVSSSNKIQTSSATNIYGSNIARDELRNNSTVIADYIINTDTLGSSFFLSGQYAKYNTDYDDDIAESGGAAKRYLQNIFVQNLHISSIQTDRSQIFSKRSKLETGIRFSAVGNSSLTQFAVGELPEGTFNLEPALSSIFRYRESIAAAYASFSTRIKKLQTIIGIRGESTSYALETDAGKGQDFRKSYINLFPSLQIELPVGKEDKLRIAYLARINRPRYQALNPFVIYQDSFTTIEGNPDLVPEQSHAVELAANISKTELKIAYTYTRDLLSGAALRGTTPESYVLKSINISKDQGMLLSVTRPFSISNWLASVNTATLSYNKSFDNQYEFATGKTRPQLYLYSSNTFNVKNGFRLQLLAWYLGEQYYGLGHRNSRSTITAGIEKSFLNGLKIGLTANDIFNLTASVGDYYVGKTQIYYDRSYGNNYFRLTASYRFGGSDKAIAQDKRRVQSENNRAN